VLGVYLPRSAEQQWAVGQKVKLEDIRPGDVLFFSNTYKPGISHNAIYAGGGRFIHASRSNKVTISYLSASYWQKKFTGVRRFDNMSLPKNPIVSEAIRHVGESVIKKAAHRLKKALIRRVLSNMSIKRRQEWNFRGTLINNTVQVRKSQKRSWSLETSCSLKEPLF
jgi:hypothetical protein